MLLLLKKNTMQLENTRIQVYNTYIEVRQLLFLSVLTPKHWVLHNKLTGIWTNSSEEDKKRSETENISFSLHVSQLSFILLRFLSSSSCLLWCLMFINPPDLALSFPLFQPNIPKLKYCCRAKICCFKNFPRIFDFSAMSCLISFHF